MGKGVKLDPSSGDRLGLLSLQNMQLLITSKDRRSVLTTGAQAATTVLDRRSVTRTLP